MKVLVDMSHRTRNLDLTLSLIYYGTTWTVIFFFFQVLGFLIVRWSWYSLLCQPYKDMVLVLLLFLPPNKLPPFLGSDFHGGILVSSVLPSTLLKSPLHHKIHHVCHFPTVHSELKGQLPSAVFLEYIWVWISSIYTFTENVYTLNCQCLPQSLAHAGSTLHCPTNC